MTTLLHVPGVFLSVWGGIRRATDTKQSPSMQDLPFEHFFGICLRIPVVARIARPHLDY